MKSVSIVSACLDDVPFLDEAVRSVVPPENVHVEHILVHDGSEHVREQLRLRYPHMQVVAGDGRGPVAAFNRGLSMAKGEFIGILPADDLLHPQALSLLCERSEEHRTCRIWTGGLVFFAPTPDGGRRIIRELTRRADTELRRENVLDGPPLWSGRFYRRNIYEEFGLLSERFAECNDREFMLRLVEAGEVDGDLGGPVGLFRVHPGSRTTSPTGKRVVTFLASHLELGKEMSALGGASERRQYQNWHARELCRLLYHLLSRGRWAEALAVVRRETMVNRFWPVRALSMIGATVRSRR